MNNFTILPLGDEHRTIVEAQVAESWGSSLIVSRGVLHDPRNLEGFIATDSGKLTGYTYYSITENACEIVVLEALIIRRGIGSAIIREVLRTAKASACTRVWLVTSNDNTQAIRFYQRFGFELAAVYLNAMDEARLLKPQIPLLGDDDIPIKHEFEFEIILA